jgi:hypothetical protein
MLFNRAPILIIAAMCLGTICVLFNIKNGVMAIRSELSQVKKQICLESDAIHVLKAELSYLTSPSRLQALNSKYLKLEDTKVAQMISDPRVESKILKSTSFAKLNRSNVKWRYKKGPSKYVTLTSGKNKR